MKKYEGIVKKYIDDSKEEYLKRVYSLKNPFYIAFYELSICNAVADGYDFFIYTSCESNFFKENILALNFFIGRKFIKMIAVFHTVKLLQLRKDILSDEMAENLFYIFDFDENEKKLFEIFLRCINEFENKFYDLFARAFAKYIFGVTNLSPFSLAFVENFCYNSYSAFMSSFTRFITLERRVATQLNA